MSDLHKLETPKISDSHVETNRPYQDPENADEIVEKLKECENHDQVVNLINETFPGWILGWPKRYGVDFPSFQNNWEYVCKKSGTRTLSVIIVDTIVFNDTKYKLLKMFCEILTLFGHSVRRKGEFIGCKMCGDAIPSESVFLELVERKNTTLPCWMIKCREC
jgi:hypothetical protein